MDGDWFKLAEKAQKNKTICLDFDGVLNTFDGWKGEEELFQPKPNVGKFLAELNDRGFELVIHTTRDPEKVLKWLQKHGLDKFFREIDTIAVLKPIALAYIDDRAIRFEGSFDNCLMKVDFGLKTYWEK